jgi:predicted Zn-dependent protease
MKNNHTNGSSDRTTPADYLRAAKALLGSNKQKDAFTILQQAMVRYPDEPVLLSYFGCLQAIVDKKYRSGVEACTRAILLLKDKENVDVEKFYPLFYLNLGRAYLAAGKKQDALNAFKKGTKYDPGYRDLMKELRGMGMRKRPAVAFLSRSNPINKYIGLLLHKDDKAPGKARAKRTV